MSLNAFVEQIAYILFFTQKKNPKQSKKNVLCSIPIAAQQRLGVYG